MTKFRPLVLDTDSLRERMNARLLEINKTTRGAARDAGIGESTIRNLMEGRSKSPRMSTLISIGKALEVGPGWFFLSAIQEEDETSENRTRININEWLEINSTQDAPLTLDERKENLHRIMNEQIRLVYPILRRDGSYLVDLANQIFSEKPILPAMKLFRQYLFVVRNDRMWPVFRKQDQLLIDPDYALKDDEDYVFRQRDEAGKWLAWLARLQSHDQDTFQIRLFNPEETLTLDRHVWVKAEGVVARLAPMSRDEDEDQEG